MDQWVTIRSDLPDLKEPVWGYGCDGSLLLVCRLYELNENSSWELGAEKTQCWCVLRSQSGYEEGELLPIKFITEWAEFNAEVDREPVTP